MKSSLKKGQLGINIMACMALMVFMAIMVYMAIMADMVLMGSMVFEIKRELSFPRFFPEIFFCFFRVWIVFNVQR